MPFGEEWTSEGLQSGVIGAATVLAETGNLEVEGRRRLIVLAYASVGATFDFEVREGQTPETIFSHRFSVLAGQSVEFDLSAIPISLEGITSQDPASFRLITVGVHVGAVQGSILVGPPEE